jgi:crossover junction endodeoxyribonuclease RuvC
MHTLFSIDPGKTGAVAVFADGLLTDMIDPDANGLARPFADRLLDAIDFRHSVTVVIEKVNGVPGQSGPAAFNFGDGFGQLKGVCIGLGFNPILVPPATWKQAMGLRGLDKGGSIDAAQRLWGNKLFHLKKHDGRAEAALLGQYWLQLQGRAAA